MTSTQNSTVIAGKSITLRCGQPHQEITWYKDESDVPLTRGQALSILNASSKDEGTYHCAVDQGLKGSVKVLVIGRCMKAILNQTRAGGKNWTII